MTGAGATCSALIMAHIYDCDTSVVMMLRCAETGLGHALSAAKPHANIYNGRSFLKNIRKKVGVHVQAGRKAAPFTLRSCTALVSSAGNRATLQATLCWIESFGLRDTIVTAYEKRRGSVRGTPYKEWAGSLSATRSQEFSRQHNEEWRQAGEGVVAL